MPGHSQASDVRKKRQKYASDAGMCPGILYGRRECEVCICDSLYKKTEKISGNLKNL